MCTENLIRVALAAVLALASARCHRRLPLYLAAVAWAAAFLGFAVYFGQLLMSETKRR